jgi:uncharacterized membrane protein YeaQ/YmgE (transglycosylase-associated protein family)
MNLLADYGWFAWILIGALAGGIARLIMPGRGPSGCLLTILLGVGGAVVAGWLGHQLGWYDSGDGAGFLAAIVGAMIILGLYGLISGRR